MGRKSRIACSLLLFFVIFIDLGRKAQAAPISFTFAAAGDHSANSRVTSSLDLLANSGASFYLALGDMSYSQLVPESAWCDYVKTHVAATFPFELLAGNHEDNGPDGLIENFATCLPDKLGNISGEYGKEYYFDYPSTAPLARFILISPNLMFSDGQTYRYTVGSARYQWLTDRIDEARIAGIQWVIVGMHEDCLSIATKPCEISPDLMNLLISKKVDLVLQAHDHTYQRSKQLALSDSCPAVVPDTFNAGCVVDDGSDQIYTAGNGTLFVIDATFGAELYNINLLDPEVGYFAKWMGLNADPRFGFMKYTVSDTGISAQFIGSTAGTFTDSFTLLAGSATLTPPPTATQSPIPSATFTPSSTNTAPPGNANLNFAVEADARVKQVSPATNYGSLTYLSVDGAPDPIEESYLRFTVTGLNGPVQSAKLRVYVTANGTVNGPAVQLASNSWTESTLTWNNKPALLSAASDNKGALGTNTWIEYDVTPLLNGNGTYTFALIADSTDGAEFSSREGAFPAQLIVTYATSGSTSTQTASATSTQTATLTPSLTRTLTSTPSATRTATSTRTETAIPTTTDTALPTFTDTAVSIPSNTSTSLPTNTVTATVTDTSTAAATNTATLTPVETQTPSATLTETAIPTNTSTLTSTLTVTPVPTSTHTPTLTPSRTSTATLTATPTNSRTPTATFTATRTPTSTQSRTPTATQTQSRTPTSTISADLIFADSFESGSLSAWTSASIDGGDLSVNTAAALVGSQGLRAVINNTTSIYVTDDKPSAEPRYRARFYFDPNSITMASGNAHYIFYGSTGTSTDVLRIEFRRSSGLYQLQAALRNDKSTWTVSSWFTISDAPHFLELDWRASTAAGANNGGLTFWIDGVQQANLTGVDNDTRRIDRIRLGAVSGLDSGTSGIYYFDAFESRKQTYIGPAP